MPDDRGRRRTDRERSQGQGQGQGSGAGERAGGRRGGDRSSQRPSQRARTGDPARLAAYTVLRAVDTGAYANLELPRVLRDRRITGRDAAFATELAYGATRLRGRYDPIVAAAADRPVSAIDPAVLDTLRLGMHQLLGMRVPPHAATAETVALARQVNGAGAAGFVNAVLRRAAERDLAEWLDVVAPEKLPSTDRLAIRFSHPPWIVAALRAALLGHGRADAATVQPQLEALLEADNIPAKVALAARPGLADVAELIESGADPGRWASTAAVLPQGDPGSLPAVRESRAAVQDEGSQLVALAMASVQVDTDGPERWLDLCAGPGGKAGLLAALALERGASFVANDVNAVRAGLVAATLAPLLRRSAENQIEVRVSDGRDVGSDEPACYDRVLVDAPCTGLGALRRRPEARWRRTQRDLAELTRLQRELLAAALDAARPGGVVGYSTCSPHLAETRFAVQDVLKHRADAETLDATGLFVDVSGRALPDLGAGPYVQLWPHAHGTDGMFFALLRKRV